MSPRKEQNAITCKITCHAGYRHFNFFIYLKYYYFYDTVKIEKKLQNLYHAM